MRRRAANTSSTMTGISSHGQTAARRSRTTGCSAWERISAAIKAQELGFAEGGGIHAEADERRARVRGHLELGDLERVQTEVVAMGLAGRRARAPVPRGAEIRAPLLRTGRQQTLL